MVLRLTEQIRNCILVHQQPDQRVARSGDLCAGRVWRAPYLNDDRVFLCPEEENCPAFTVDLLLDASASRLHCQEVIAAQGVILAESLANCGIPVRVSAFSSLRGYTVLRVLKSFTDKNRQNIFRYFASGWNRDGLALRAAGDLIRYVPGPAPRHLMILLTDASPNDSRRIPPTAQNPLGCAYEDAAGVADTAAQVRTLQRQGVRVSAVLWARTAAPVPPRRSTAKYGAHPRHGSACPRCRTTDPERDSGTWRLKIKNDPCGNCSGLSRHFPQGSFFTTVYFKVQPSFEPLFALRHKFLQKFVVSENLQLFLLKSMLYYVQRSFMQPVGPITRLVLLQRFAVCFYCKARS